MLSRAARAAVIGLLVAACSPAATTTSPPQTSATPSTSASEPTAPASPSASRQERAVPVPERVWGDWLADVGDTLSDLGIKEPSIQLSFNWDGGRTAWVQLNSSGNWVAQSTSIPAADREIRLRADAQSVGCDAGDEGRYSWNRSDDGLFLTIRSVEDDCALRAAALERTWVRSLGAVNDGGPGVARLGSLLLHATFPSMRFAMGASEIHTFEPGDPEIVLVLVENPVGFAAPCDAEDRTALPLSPGRQGLADYVGSLPGFRGEVRSVPLDGRPAIHVDGVIEDSLDCAAGEVRVIRPPDPQSEEAWSVAPGTVVSLWIVDIDDKTFLLWYTGAGVGPREEQAFIDSVRIVEALPTP
jgi:hypothetical protein